MPHTPVLKLDHVSKSFARVDTNDITHAVSDISLELEKGEFVCLVGTSGCGKSTLLRLIAGLIQPTMGQIMANGKPVEGPSPQRGMVFQQPTLFPWLTVEQNIAFSFRMAGTLKQNRAKVDRMLETIGLEPFRRDYPGQLSGGMAQRVALARTLICEPEILLLDEPLGALDAFTRMNMQDEIRSIWHSSGQLVIMVTHDVDEAVNMSTRVVIMEAHPGRIKAQIPIDLGEERHRSSPAFVEYRNRILGLLNY